MAGLKIPMSQTSITTDSEQHLLRIPLSWCDEWLQGNAFQELDNAGEVGCNVSWEVFVAVIWFVIVIGTPHGDPMLDGFVGLQWAEARLILKTVNNSPLIRSEERKNIL